MLPIVVPILTACGLGVLEDAATLVGEQHDLAEALLGEDELAAAEVAEAFGVLELARRRGSSSR